MFLDKPMEIMMTHMAPVSIERHHRAEIEESPPNLGSASARVENSLSLRILIPNRLPKRVFSHVPEQV
jgi:hypothetical protein